MADSKASQVPDFFDPEKLNQVYRVPYQERAEQAREYARIHNLIPAAEVDWKVELVLIDVQNTFCIPGFELFVAGPSGTGAVDDNQRLVSWIYKNLDQISGITFTMDTHNSLQIFHPLFLVDQEGNHPAPGSQISLDEIQAGVWVVNPAASDSLGYAPEVLNRYLERYVRELEEMEKYQLTIWPYHAMLGGIGHALVSGVEEAVFFHSAARNTAPDIIQKGFNPFTEAYSAVGPEILIGPGGEQVGRKSTRLLEKLKNVDQMVITGQAKSHCVAFTIQDLLQQIQAEDPGLSKKIYLLEDCTSPVVIPGVMDFSSLADRAFQDFQEAGMQLISSEMMLGQD
jgi:nicotinamidase-related amidase